MLLKQIYLKAKIVLHHIINNVLLISLEQDQHFPDCRLSLMLHTQWRHNWLISFVPASIYLSSHDTQWMLDAEVTWSRRAAGWTLDSRPSSAVKRGENPRELLIWEKEKRGHKCYNWTCEMLAPVTLSDQVTTAPILRVCGDQRTVRIVPSQRQ